MYAMLSAHFLAALQVLVYAGAIMVLFIFVVMVLNKDEPEHPMRDILTKLAGACALTYLVWKLYHFFDGAVPANVQDVPPEFGTVANVGEILFNDYLFAFEAVSLLLLVAVIAAVVVARTHKREVAAPEHEEEHAAAGHLHGSSH
jgi:NADH-quinone oxidoreductase subunit J